MSALEKFNMAPSYSLYDEMIPFCIGWLISRSLLEQEVAKVSILARTKRKVDFQHVCKDAEGYKLLNRKGVISLEFSLVHIRFNLFQLLQDPFQLILEVVVATDAEIFTDTAAIGGDGLIVRDAVELEQLLQVAELSVRLRKFM